MIQESLTPCSYFCKYQFLDEQLMKYIGSNQTVNLYFDTKNVLSSLHNPSEQASLIHQYNSSADKYVVARTIIVLANHWMRYFKKRNIGCNIFFFDERGNSVYHNSHNREYKSNRQTSKQRIASDLFLEDDFYEKFYLVYDKNIAVISNIFKILNGLFYIRLKDLESDFIPKLIINEYFTSNGKMDTNYMHIIVSNDKDFVQLLDNNNTLQIVRIMKEKTFEIRSSMNGMYKFTGVDDDLKDNRFIPLLLSMAGDVADNVKGLSGLGYKTGYRYINKLYKDKIITEDDYHPIKFINKINEYKKINPSYLNDLTTTKILSNTKILEENYKLTSFKEVLNWLSYDQKKKILKQLEKVNSNDQERSNYLSQLCNTTTSYDFLL